MQIYIATGQLLCLGGLSLDSGSILASAEADVVSISPENKLKPKGTTAAVKSRLGLGNRKPLPSTPSSSSLHGPSPDPSVSSRYRICFQSLRQVCDQLLRVLPLMQNTLSAQAGYSKYIVCGVHKDSPVMSDVQIE